MNLVLPNVVRHALFLVLLLIRKTFLVSSLSSVLLSYYVTMTKAINCLRYC